MLKISKYDMKEFWGAVENETVINPETKNRVKLKSLRPEEFDSHRQILKRYWDQWEKYKKEQKMKTKPEIQEETKVENRDEMTKKIETKPKVESKKIESKKIGDGFSLPVEHGSLNQMSIPEEQKEEMKNEVLKNGILIEGVGEEGLKGETEKNWISKQLNIDPNSVKVKSYDDIFIENYPNKESLAYATFSNEGSFKNDKRYNPKKPKTYVKTLLKDTKHSFQGYEFTDDEIDKYIAKIEETDPDVLKPNRFKDSGELADAIYFLTFDGPGEQNDDGSNKNPLGNMANKVLVDRRQNLIDIQKKDGGVSFIGSGHFEALKSTVDSENNLNKKARTAMLKISKKQLNDFWKSVENVTVTNPETKNKVKLKSLRPEEFDSHKKILKQYWDKWEKSNKSETEKKPKKKLDMKDIKADYKNTLSTEEQEEAFKNPEVYKKNYMAKTPQGSQLLGTKHLDENSKDWIEKSLLPNVKDFIEQAKKDGKEIVFLGEGGKGDGDNYPEGTEQELVGNLILEAGGKADTWDGKDNQLGMANSAVAKAMRKELGTTEAERMTLQLAINVGHGNNIKEEMEWFNELPKEMQEEGEKFLRDNGYDGKFPPKGKKDAQKLYDLTFPRDYNKPEQKISQLMDYANDFRGKTIIKKIKEYEDQGKRVLVTPGADHVYALRDNFKSPSVSMNKKGRLINYAIKVAYMREDLRSDILSLLKKI